MTDTTIRDARAPEREVDADAPATDADVPATDAGAASRAETNAPAETTPGETSPDSSSAAASATSASAAREAALFDDAAAKDLQVRWQAIQVGFVDEPRGAVEQADKLVDEVMQRLADSFAKERDELEHAWSGGSEASTEDLRQAIRRYRSFFNRLLAI